MQIPAKSPAASKNDPLSNLLTNNLNNQVKTNLKILWYILDVFFYFSQGLEIIIIIFIPFLSMFCDISINFFEYLNNLATYLLKYKTILNYRPITFHYFAGMNEIIGF